MTTMSTIVSATLGPKLGIDDTEHDPTIPAHGLLSMSGRISRQLAPALAQLARRMRRLGPKESGAVVLLAGIGRGIGTSTVALALAQAASVETPVLLVDADFEQAGLTRMLAVLDQKGWDEAVRGECSFEASQRSLDARWRTTFAALSRRSLTSAGLLDRPALRIWLPLARQQFGLIFVDGGQISPAICGWSSCIDLAMVVCTKETTVAARAEAWDLLEEGGAQVLGVIETDLGSAR